MAPRKDERRRACGVESFRMPVTYPELSAPPEAENTLKCLLAAAQAEDYDAFIGHGTHRFQQGISKEMFDTVSRQVANRLKAGHSTEFLTEINQCDHRVFLWKLSFADAGNQFIARLALATDGKVAGFMLN
jgi:hypothetical protein